MENNSDKNNQEKNWLSLLPENVRELLISPELSEKLVNICSKYKLSEKPRENKLFVDPGTEKVINLVIKILKGELPLKDFSKSLEKELNIDSIIIKKISAEMDQQIFFNIRASLEKSYETMAGNKEKTTYPVKPPSVTPQREQIRRKPDTYREPTL